MHTPEMEIVGYDAIEFHVGNARQAAHFYRTGFGFRLVAYAGPETGVRDRVSYVLEQGGIRFVVTAGLTPEHPVTRWQLRHGDGIRDVAFRVPDAEAAFALATERGAVPLHEPEVLTDEHGKLTVAAIAVYGDTIHSLVQRDDYSGSYRPGFVAVPDPLAGAGDAAFGAVGLHGIDHVVANVHLGDMEPWVAFYQRILGFSQLRHFDDETISTEDTALMSKVLADGRGRVKLPINEPATGRKRSQIEEYLDANRGAGIQHLALATDDIVGTVRTLTARGIRFLAVPETYYQEVRERIGEVDESWDDLARCGILVDRDEEGYLLQIFTEPVQDRPTLFYEIIQRRGAQGFGVRNFRSLFAAVEREQARRGNL
jgi:4-hydroxyphenylpyruvate dioxygenase